MVEVARQRHIRYTDPYADMPITQQICCHSTQLLKNKFESLLWVVSVLAVKQYSQDLLQKP